MSMNIRFDNKVAVVTGGTAGDDGHPGVKKGGYAHDRVSLSMGPGPREKTAGAPPGNEGTPGGKDG